MSTSCAICNMMYDAYAMRNDAMMLCYVRWCLFRRYTHIPAIKHIIFYKPPLGASSPFTSAESAFIFRCKPPLGASSPFTSAESTFIFRCKLCIPFGTTFEQKTYAALPKERLFVISEILLVTISSYSSATFWTPLFCEESIFVLWQRRSYYKKLKTTKNT